jgi:PAS domain S-box-containing protein
MNQSDRTILVIDDSAAARERYRRYLIQDEAHRYTILEAQSGEEGLALWQRHQPDTTLLDCQLPDLDGLEWLAQKSIQIQQPCVPVIVLIEQGNEPIAMQAIKAGAQDYLIKEQITPERLHLSVNRAMETAELLQINVQLQQSIHQYQQTEVALHQREQRFRAIFDNMFQFIGALTPEGTVIEGNQTALTAIAADRSDVIGKPFWETPWWTHSPQLQAQVKQAIARAANGEMVRFESEHIWADGSTGFVDFSLKPVLDEAGKVIMLIPEGRDITERKQVEVQLRQQEEFLKSLYEGTEQAIFVVDITTDRDFCYASFNPVSERYAGVTNAQIQGKTPEEAFGEVFGSTLRQNYGRCLQANASITYEEQLDFEAHSIWTLTTLSPLKNEQGQIYRIIGTATDISDRKQAEVELQHQKQDLARSNAELQQFAYVASHDLQEPLRMITSYLELLERRYKGQLDAKADKFIAYAVDGAARMQTLINDLLSYSRVGTREQKFESVDSAKIVQNVLRNLEVAIAQSNAAITHDPLPYVNADPSQLTQLFQNLIGNAIKFRGEDPPQIHIGVKGTDGKWLFSVRDNGMGIDAQYLDRIFIIFQRLHSRTEYPGTGIGLALCKKIVERHGGTLRVESHPDQGSTFHFTLPHSAGNPL